MPASSLEDAINQFWTAQGLNVSVGKLYAGKGNPGTSPPWVKMTTNKGNLKISHSEGRIYDRRVYLRVVATGGADVNGRADLVQAAFVPSAYEGKTFEYDGATGPVTTYPAVLIDRMGEPEPGYSVGGNPAYAQQIELQFLEEMS